MSQGQRARGQSRRGVRGQTLQGILKQGKDLEVYFKCDKKPLNYFEQGSYRFFYISQAEVWESTETSLQKLKVQERFCTGERI